MGWNDRALEQLDDAKIGRAARAEIGKGRVDFGRAVEVAAAVRVMRGDGGGVARVEGERVHLPASAPEAGIARSRGGDVGLRTVEVVDRLEARLWSPSVREVGRCADGLVEHTVDVDRGRCDAT